MTQGTILDFFLSRAVIYILTSSSNLIFRSLRSIRLDPLITLASISTISHIWSLTRFIGAFFESSSRNFCDISSHDEICLYYEKTAFISISRNNNLGHSVFFWRNYDYYRISFHSCGVIHLSTATLQLWEEIFSLFFCSIFMTAYSAAAKAFKEF